MSHLEIPELHYLSAAIGWLELGNPAESKAELALLSAEFQNHPDVLEVRWMLAAHEKDWDAALKTARQLVETDPERTSGWLHQAYALRRVSDGGVRKAWEALLPVHSKFPQEPTISYNLACYACQMDDLNAARVWLKQAAAVGSKDRIKEMALSDPDLQPLWGEIQQL